MNNNKTDENALLGVFAKTGYISIGTAENPLGLQSQQPLPERWKAKQFTTAPPHSGRTPETFFDKKFADIAEGDTYVDKWRYNESGQEKKKGFLTSDYSKRDEFSNTVRTLQWREQLQHEHKWTKQVIDFFNEAAAQGGAELSSTAAAAACADGDGPLLFDLVFEKAGDPKAPACSKTHRDTKNSTALSHERHPGPSRTTNALAFAAPVIQPASHAPGGGTGKQLIRHTFDRKTNILFPPGCDSTTAGQ